MFRLIPDVHIKFGRFKIFIERNDKYNPLAYNISQYVTISFNLKCQCIK